MPPKKKSENDGAAVVGAIGGVTAGLAGLGILGIHVYSKYKEHKKNKPSIIVQDERNTPEAEQAFGLINNILASGDFGRLADVDPKTLAKYPDIQLIIKSLIRVAEEAQKDLDTKMSVDVLVAKGNAITAEMMVNRMATLDGKLAELTTQVVQLGNTLVDFDARDAKRSAEMVGSVKAVTRDLVQFKKELSDAGASADNESMKQIEVMSNEMKELLTRLGSQGAEYGGMLAAFRQFFESDAQARDRKLYQMWEAMGFITQMILDNQMFLRDVVQPALTNITNGIHMLPTIVYNQLGELAQYYERMDFRTNQSLEGLNTQCRTLLQTASSANAAQMISGETVKLLTNRVTLLLEDARRQLVASESARAIGTEHVRTNAAVRLLDDVLPYNELVVRTPENVPGQKEYQLMNGTMIAPFGYSTTEYEAVTLKEIQRHVALIVLEAALAKSTFQQTAGLTYPTVTNSIDELKFVAIDNRDLGYSATFAALTLIAAELAVKQNIIVNTENLVGIAPTFAAVFSDRNARMVVDDQFVAIVYQSSSEHFAETLYQDLHNIMHARYPYIEIILRIMLEADEYERARLFAYADRLATVTQYLSERTRELKVTSPYGGDPTQLSVHFYFGPNNGKEIFIPYSASSWEDPNEFYATLKSMVDELLATYALDI